MPRQHSAWHQQSLERSMYCLAGTFSFPMCKYDNAIFFSLVCSIPPQQSRCVPPGTNVCVRKNLKRDLRHPSSVSNLAKHKFLSSGNVLLQTYHDDASVMVPTLLPKSIGRISKKADDERVTQQPLQFRLALVVSPLSTMGNGDACCCVGICVIVRWDPWCRAYKIPHSYDEWHGNKFLTPALVTRLPKAHEQVLRAASQKSRHLDLAASFMRLPMYGRCNWPLRQHRHHIV